MRPVITAMVAGDLVALAAGVAAVLIACSWVGRRLRRRSGPYDRCRSLSEPRHPSPFVAALIVSATAGATIAYFLAHAGSVGL